MCNPVRSRQSRQRSYFVRRAQLEPYRLVQGDGKPSLDFRRFSKRHQQTPIQLLVNSGSPQNTFNVVHTT